LIRVVLPSTAHTTATISSSSTTQAKTPAICNILAQISPHHFESTKVYHYLTIQSQYHDFSTMKLHLFIYLLVSLFALATVAVAPQKAVIVTYPEGTPDSVMNQAKDAIRKAGGMITHEYKLIK
jgi:hypothetical protein